MKICLSNLAWNEDRNDEIYWFMQKIGICGLEMAPTKIFGANPYEDLSLAKKYAKEIREDFSIEIMSMQSLWFNRPEKIFVSEAEREILSDYTKKAIIFSEALGCKNLVFGCPKNRVIGNKENLPIAYRFFGELGSFSEKHGVVLSLEANPAIYGTDFINTTREALDFCKSVGVEGLKVNLDFGTIIYNNEKLDFTEDDIRWINHLHISEPNLVPIIERSEHIALRDILCRFNYNGAVSIEMGISESNDDILDAAVYLKEVFG